MTGAHPRANTLRLRRAGLLIGCALLIAAVALVVHQRHVFGTALAAMRDPSATHLVLLGAGIAGNLLLTGLLFSLLMSRCGRVGLLEMQAVMAAATLFNYLPMRPGLLGRVAWHAAHNGIAPSSTIKATLQAMACSLLIAGFLALVIAVSAASGLDLWPGAAAPLPLLGLAALWKRARIWALAGAVRYLEFLVWAVRCWAAFALIGAPIDAQTALALACVSMIATLVPLFGNGLGLREWAIALSAPYLTSTALQLEHGLAAEMLNRAAEMAIVTVAGLCGTVSLARRPPGRP